jgi:alpha-1,2-mannosyltransferase
MLRALRDADWLTGSRARAYAVILAILLLVSAGVVVHARMREAAQHPHHLPEATDFLPFYTAGRLAATGRPADAYRLSVLVHEEQARAIMQGGSLPFLYPPPMLLLCAAVSALPFALAWLAFEAVGLVPLVWALRRVLPQRWALFPLLTAPAVLMNLGSGQTGFLTAACFAWAAVLLDARPALAGVVLGLLVAKPHLAVLIPVALFAARRWRAAAACAAAAATLCAVSWLVFGSSTWTAFLAQAPLAREVLEQWPADWRILLSGYGAVRVLGGGVALAYAAQAVLALVATALLAATTLRRPGAPAEMSMLAAAALFATPYGMDYDLPILLLPAVWIVGLAQRSGWRGWEKITLSALFVLPLFVRASSLLLGVPVAPPVLGAVLWVTQGRGRRPGALPVDPAGAGGPRPHFYAAPVAFEENSRRAYVGLWPSCEARRGVTTPAGPGQNPGLLPL